MTEVGQQPSLACRILALLPGDYALRDQPIDTLPPNTYFEDALVELDTGQRLAVFDPPQERTLIGRRCLVEMAAVFGDYALTEEDWSIGGRRPFAMAGAVSGYYRDGVLVDAGRGTVGVLECLDDRFEPGRFIRVTDARLDWIRLRALEDPARSGVWIPTAGDPFSDLPTALSALRAGEAVAQEVPSVALDKRLNVVRPGTTAHLTIRGGSVAHLIYRFGQAGFREAERDVAALLEHPDHDVRRAAAWVLSRYWSLSPYVGQITERAVRDDVVNVREAALLGMGILRRSRHDAHTTRLLTAIIRDRTVHWHVREAAYLALLGVWLPETKKARESWRRWKPGKGPWLGKLLGRNFEWGARVDWKLVENLERGSS